MNAAARNGVDLIPNRAPAFLHEFFLASACRWPNRIAVEVPSGPARPHRSRTTYAELDARSAALAGDLHDFVRSECVVAILLPRDSAWLYAAQLAVLRSGAAYTCLDPGFPEDRIQTILLDCRAVALITDGPGEARGRSAGVASARILRVDRIQPPPSGMASRPTPPPWLTPSSLAYVIYTSGTSGRPKGVMIEHRSVTNLVDSDITAFGLGPDDRVAQGSSAAYDSSIEETWLAFAVGASVVVMDEETARLGPDLVPWLRDERVTVFCPPPTQLRATGCEDPAAELPELSFLYVGGEPLPRDVADRWARGRRLVNGYGPTECTITCLRTRIAPGGPIGIGRPVPGARAWVLDESLAEVAPGTTGELCLGGIGLARGYLGRPDLTAERFIDHPDLGRLYRTGDLARQDANGEFFHLGRRDSQVKVRGYRIELEEIEAHLSRCPGVRAAACRVQGTEASALLVGFVVPEDPAHPPDAAGLTARLRASLPAYMVPTRLGFLPEFPLTVGGKLNRAALPLIDASLPGSSADNPAPILAPRDPREQRIAAGYAAVLRIRGPLSIDQDFFRDLGGDSLRAAELVTWLRRDPSTAAIAARDIYEFPTIAALAAAAPPPPRNPGANRSSPTPTEPAREATSTTETLSPTVVSLLQGLWLAKDWLLVSASAYFVTFHLLPALAERLDWLALILLAPCFAVPALVAYTAASLGWAVWLKRRLIGHYRPRRARVGSSHQLRHWMVQRAVARVPWWLLEGTEFTCLALRALGARIGRRVHVHRGVDLFRGAWDLLDIGDDATLGQESTLGLVEFDRGDIVFAPVSIAAGATLEWHAYVGAGARVEEDACLAARAWLMPGATLPARQRWDGIPARTAGPASASPEPPGTDRNWTPLRAGCWMILARLALLLLLALPAEATAIVLGELLDSTPARLSSWLVHPLLDLRLVVTSIALFTLPVPATVILMAAACRAMGPVPPGTGSRWRPGFIRLWLKTGLLEAGSQWLYGTLFWPYWLRLAGMKIGRGCEISSLMDTLPENVAIGEGTFCADGIYLGGARIQRGTFTVAPLRIGKNCFFGNGAILPGGLEIPDDVLFGVCTVAGHSPIRPGSSWFGHPPFELPRRHVVELDPRLTHLPSPWRIGIRFFWEALRFALPVLPALILPCWYLLMARAAEAWPAVLVMTVAAPLANLAAATATTLGVVGLKWALLGRVRPGMHPLWSSWASRWDFVCLAWNLHMKPVVGTLDGTPGLALILRAMGIRLGRGVVLGTGFADDIPDPDMLRLEDGATVDCLFQAHTFEDRVLKMDYIHVRAGATLGRQAVLLYGTDIGAGARVAPNSVVMKGEHLLPGRDYAGFPVRS